MNAARAQEADKAGEKGTAQTQNVTELLAENKRLALEVKKLTRALANEQAANQRNKANFEAKRQFSDIVLAERSRLENNMNLLLSNSKDYILFFDTADNILFCTDSFLQTNGIAAFAQLQGKSFKQILGELLPKDFFEEVESLKSSVQSVQSVYAEAAADHLERQMRVDFGSSGVARDYMAELTILKNDTGAYQGMLLTFYDTTDLIEMRREAERANAAKSDFLATISHEIRTPMNAIIGLAGMLQDTKLTKKQSELLTKMQTSSTAMLNLINDILDFSKIEAGKLELINEYFELPVLLEELKSIFSLMMEQKGLAFNCDFAADLPQVVFADDKRIRQVLTNILNNAYKYTPKGQVDFIVSNTVSGAIRFDVRDTGLGIKPEEKSRLFNEFEQLDVVKNKHVSGTGLGLAITKKLIDMMSGSINVESVYGKGSIFSVVLDLKRGSISDLPQSFDSSLTFTAPGARILVVDDVEVNLEIASFMLEPFEVEADFASDGFEAVEKVRAGSYDLVLMDHMMPRMDGVEATKCIRELPLPLSMTPVVALTANAISGNEKMFASMGFDGFISKPIDVNVLARTLYEFLPDELIRT
ncbi:MAG: response regulator [Coriobacteriales bacterium]|jgi:signal transduction histidine kinase/ActR/RegA family two-component response regulator|nr:response regulator [Coriobacteriales bacterium]